ncbi:MAG: nicotinate (nicotinamide) nucleotide adenylyltransferase [Fidelibacterota bacterium]|nr:MAG: nicotinate (nicotinamide) nucleotide adenylyltransferase [Candidatus Neomarinimicrobiota bacterium]
MGIFGGSFDPPHNAHVDIATLAMERIPLDVLYFVPSYQAPLKLHPPSATARHRLAMISLLAEMRSDWQVLAYEVEQKRSVTTIETVEHLKHREPQASYYLIIGGDQAAKLDQWRQWEKLADLLQIVSFSRETFSPPVPVADKLMIVPFDNPLSSSLVRERIRTGGPTDAILPPAVQSYIRKHRLYQ